MTTTEARPHVHRWVIEPLDAALPRWLREGIGLEDRTVHSRCACGETRDFAHYVAGIDDGRTFKVGKGRPNVSTAPSAVTSKRVVQPSSVQLCKARKHPLNARNLYLAADGARRCRSCRREASARSYRLRKAAEREASQR